MPTRRNSLPGAAKRGRGRPGRALERLIALLRKILDPSANVQSPGSLEDKENGKQREIDVLVSTTLSSGEKITWAIECRDHRRRVDVGYIESIATKRRAVGADIAAIVSTKGFTKGAREKARIHGLRLLDADSISIAALQSWFENPVFTQFVPYVSALDFAVDHDGDDVTSDLDFGAAIVDGKLATNAPILWSGKESWSMLRVLRRHLLSHPEILADAPKRGGHVEKTFIIEPSQPSLSFRLRDGSYRLVTKISVRAQFNFTANEVELLAKRIAGPDGTEFVAHGTMMSVDENGDFAIPVDVAISRRRDGTVHAIASLPSATVKLVRR